ncbi:AraC family transcriptional regulator [Sphingobacterium thalpophilum]|uniref:AraC family transcriptional regulator n=1 Tax=Sphingobacterium thalpophilum TaxID=259 RepID=A0A4U9W1Y7_9SPHI|nr:AraC family transcriptional regulator [Sphingobacterium thalpophilum]VTR52371.1 DNA-binding transcriptional regulator MelR [Sphingobacterium thalpophilum]
MRTTTLLIKGMVCDRCTYVLEGEMVAMGFEVLEIRLGQVVINDIENVQKKMDKLKNMLQSNGFGLIYDKRQRMVNRIKELVEEGINLQVESGTPTKFTKLISDTFHKNYDSLSALFSSVEKITLEKYIIHRKIEKVKELLIYTDMSLTQIAYAMGYSSQAYLSNQLKKYTGLTSSHFKLLKQQLLPSVRAVI